MALGLWGGVRQARHGEHRSHGEHRRHGEHPGTGSCFVLQGAMVRRPERADFRGRQKRGRSGSAEAGAGRAAGWSCARAGNSSLGVFLFAMVCCCSGCGLWAVGCGLWRQRTAGGAAWNSGSGHAAPGWSGRTRHG